MSPGALSVAAGVLQYDVLWPAWFERIRARLEPDLGDLPHHIEHVGKTAVPGLVARPIDIEVVVPTAEQFPVRPRRRDA
ncbi:GrpB family protein [Kribbella alba]|uniref:GrpB family protein n=1 Tax=Kribbella alba TaxID=190197 RepID=UPI0031DE8C37